MKNRQYQRIYGGTVLALCAAILSFAPVVSAASDLIGYWNFDEATGSTAADSSSNGNNGTFFGTGAQHSLTLPPTSCFVNTHSVWFDGSGDHVEIPDNASMDPANAITITFWMNPDTVTNGYQHLVFKQGPVVTSYGVWLNGDHIYMEDNDNSVRSLSSTAAVTAGVWHYVSVTYDGSIQKLYIDGVLDNSQSLPGITLSYQNSPVKIGSGDYNNPFAGYIDDLRIYGRALTSSEIADLASGGCGPGVAGIVSQNTTPTPQATVSNQKNLTNTGVAYVYFAAAACALLLSGAAVHFRFKR